jgi:hypothetical protein
LANQAENVWRDKAVALHQEELALLDVHARDGAQIPFGSEHVSLFDLDRDFVAFRMGNLAAREDLQRRAKVEIDAEALRIWDETEAWISCIRSWDAFVDAVRAHGRSQQTDDNAKVR